MVVLLSHLSFLFPNLEMRRHSLWVRQKQESEITQLLQQGSWGAEWRAQQGTSDLIQEIRKEGSLGEKNTRYKRESVRNKANTKGWYSIQFGSFNGFFPNKQISIKIRKVRNRCIDLSELFFIRNQIEGRVKKHQNVQDPQSSGKCKSKWP